MSSRKTIDDILQEAKELAQRINNIQLEPSQRMGVDAITNAINNFSTAVGIGPPGAGKSLVPSYALARNFSNFDRDECVLVFATTNRLVSDLATSGLCWLRGLMRIHQRSLCGYMDPNLLLFALIKM
jgi:superfamily II DNA or RNA helicase